MNLYSIRFFGGFIITDEIQLGCHYDNFGVKLVWSYAYSVVIIGKSVLFNTVESMHDNVIKIMSVLMFSW